MQINTVILSGHLTADPELRHTQSGEGVANFTIANNRKYTTQGERREIVAFIAVVAWGALSDVAIKYLKKGSPVVVEGRLEQERWEDKSGTKKSKTKVSATRLHLIHQVHKTEQTDDVQPSADEVAA